MILTVTRSDTIGSPRSHPRRRVARTPWRRPTASPSRAMVEVPRVIRSDRPPRETTHWGAAAAMECWRTSGGILAKTRCEGNRRGDEGTADHAGRGVCAQNVAAKRTVPRPTEPRACARLAAIPDRPPSPARPWTASALCGLTSRSRGRRRSGRTRGGAIRDQAWITSIDRWSRGDPGTFAARSQGLGPPVGRLPAARGQRGVGDGRPHQRYHTGSRPGGGPTGPHPGVHAAIRRPPVHLPHRLAGHRLCRLQPVPVPLE